MLNFIIGTAVSVLSGLGVGGGGLLVIWLVKFLNVGQLEAQTTNLLFFIVSSIASMTVHIKERKLNYKLIGFLCALGAIGVLIGSIAAKKAEPALIRKCFGFLLLFSGIISIVKSLREK